MSRVAIVGDIHGNVERLRAALRVLDEDGRHVIFLGDYVNWGESSAAVLEELTTRSLHDPTRYTFLVGNHELALLAYLADGQFPAFAATGGVPTIRSYLETVHGKVHAAFERVFPASHRAFLERLEPYWDDGAVLVSHAGFDPGQPALRTVGAMVTGAGGSPFTAKTFPRDLVVCGHYVQSGGAPHVGEHLICIDTGCGSSDGPLTIAWLPERTFTAV